jgi:hypothetical protein
VGFGRAGATGRGNQRSQRGFAAENSDREGAKVAKTQAKESLDFVFASSVAPLGRRGRFFPFCHACAVRKSFASGVEKNGSWHRGAHVDR